MINYKLAKEIGATHHIDSLLYKFNDDGFAMCYFYDCGWEKTENDATHMAALSKIDFDNSKPRTITEYEKVVDCFFDLRDEFERGELYFKCSEGDWVQAVHESEVVHFLNDCGLYRKVEKEIDWRKETKSYLRSDNGAFKLYQLEAMLGAIAEYPEQYLEHCRVALRANGEIE